MALLILALLQRIFLMSSLMLLLVWLIFFMVFIKLLLLLGTSSGTTVMSTLSLHDALPIYQGADDAGRPGALAFRLLIIPHDAYSWLMGDPFEVAERFPRSEEHTSELQSRLHLVCRLLLEKKK